MLTWPLLQLFIFRPTYLVSEAGPEPISHLRPGVPLEMGKVPQWAPQPKCFRRLLTPPIVTFHLLVEITACVRDSGVNSSILVCSPRTQRSLLVHSHFYAGGFPSLVRTWVNLERLSSAKLPLAVVYFSLTWDFQFLKIPPKSSPWELQLDLC